MADYSQLIASKAQKYGIPANVLTELVRAESGFNPNAKSPAGAMGLGQLMPGTARSLGVTNPYDPEQNLEGTAKYLSQQLKKFGSVPLALAAYNSGPGNVQKYGGIPPFKETRNYVNKIMSNLGKGGGAYGASATTKTGATTRTGTGGDSGAGQSSEANSPNAFRDALDSAFTNIEPPTPTNIAEQAPQVQMQPMQLQISAIPGLTEDEISTLAKLFRGGMNVG